MGLTTVLKTEVQDLLAAVRLAADATAASSSGSAPESLAFLQGYHAALEAVAAGLGLELASPAARLAPRDNWIRGPRVYPAARLRESAPGDQEVLSRVTKAPRY
jgi:hypothetical protein